MAIKLCTTSIGGAQWSLNLLSATDGTEVLTQLIGMMGESASSASMDHLKKQDTVALFGAVMKGIGKPGTADLIKRLLAGLKKSTKTVNYDDEFAGNYGVLSQLVLWALRNNYESFFLENPVLSGLMERVDQARESRSDTPPTLTSVSGELS